jgi:hypothetical protein
MDSIDQDKIDTVEFQLTQSHGSMEDAKNCPKWAMLSMGIGPIHGWFGAVGDERTVQTSPATYQMDSIDSDKIDTDDFQLIQSLDPWKMQKNCPKWAIISVWIGQVHGWFGAVGDVRTVQTSPATYQINCMDPDKIDAVVF